MGRGGGGGVGRGGGGASGDVGRDGGGARVCRGCNSFKCITYGSRVRGCDL